MGFPYVKAHVKPKGTIMSSNSTLSRQVATILDALCYLPGRKGISVQTKRYPRFLPAEDGVGFEQRDWSFEGGEEPKDVAIPADAEEIVVKWKGAPDARPQIGEKMEAAVTELSSSGTTWEFQMFTRVNGSKEPDLIVEVSRSFGSVSN